DRLAVRVSRALVDCAHRDVLGALCRRGTASVNAVHAASNDLVATEDVLGNARAQTRLGYDQAHAFDGLRHVGTVGEHELALAGNGVLELAGQLHQLACGQVVIAQLHEVDTACDGVLN